MLPSVSNHMKVPAPPLNGFCGTAVHVPGVPGTGGGGPAEPPPAVGVGVGVGVRDGVGLTVGLTVGDGDVVRVGLALGVPVAAAPVHTVPFRLKLVGTGLEPDHVPLNPKLAVPLVAMDPL